MSEEDGCYGKWKKETTVMALESKHEMIDIRFSTQEDGVEVTYSPAKQTLWINVNGVCRLRAQGVTRDQLHLDTE